MLAPCQEKGR